jgi:hypothetical protein
VHCLVLAIALRQVATERQSAEPIALR